MAEGKPHDDIPSNGTNFDESERKHKVAIQDFQSDDQLYAYYNNLGESYNLRGQALLTYVTDNVKIFKEDWRKAREDKQRLIEKQMETEVEDKKRAFEKELQEAKRRHEKEMKELEISLQEKQAVAEKKQRKFEKAQKQKEDLEKKKQRKYEERLRREEREHELLLRQKQREHEEAQKRVELIERQRQREHEMLIQEKELAAKQKKLEEDATARSEKKEWQEKKDLPKMSTFKPDHDDIDAFINRFELMAKQLKWPKDKWGLYLANYLEGEALSLFNYLIVDEYIEYERLKNELLFKFKCDAEGFHERFRNGVPSSDESFHAYYTRLVGLFNRWLSMKNIGKDYDSLFDFMIVEQMLAGCCKELRVHLKERRLVKSKDIIEEANAYREARANRDVAKKGPITLAGNTQQTAAAGIDSNPPVFRGGYGQNQRGFASRGRYFSQNNQGSQAQNQPVQGNQDSKEQNSKSGNDNRQVKKICNFCKKEGHLQRDCYAFKKQQGQGHSAVTPILGTACAANVPTASGKVNGKEAIVMRDTGASVAGVRKTFVRDDQMLSEKTSVQLFDGTIKEFPTAKVHVESPFYTGEVVCCVIDTPPYDLVLGNIDGTKKGDLILASVALGCVTTRAQTKAEAKQKTPLKVKEVTDLGVTRDELIQLQLEDKTLEKSRMAARTEQKTDESDHSYIIEDDVLYRLYREKNKEPVMQIMVPKSLRLPLLQMAHECLLAGHGGRRRTTERLYSNFFWPGIHDDVKQFCRTCDRCQKTAPNIPNVPLDFMPIITEPFSKIAVDITGPFSPPSEEGHRWILSIIDIGTRFPEAIPLKKIDSQTVAEEIIKVCARMGFPSVIQSDNGSMFTSEMIKQVYRLMNIKPVFSSPYHAQSNGVVERFHGTIKPMLRKLTEKQPRRWHRLLPALLYACRDVRNVSTGFTPFELLYGRRPRGPLELVAEQWTEKNKETDKTPIQYISELREFFEEAAELVEQNVDKAAQTNKRYKDRGSAVRTFKENDDVLLLLPDDRNKLLMAWKGPFKVLECRKNDYIIEIRGKKRLYHANLLKRYHHRHNFEERLENEKQSNSVSEKSNDNTVSQNEICNVQNSELVGDDFDPQESIACIASVFLADEEEDEMTVNTLPSTEETIENAKFDDKLTEKMKHEMKVVLGTSEKLYSLQPGTFKGNLQHKIPLTTQNAIRRKQYPLPFSSQEILRKEVDYMKEIGVVEHSNSPFSSPVVLVGKKDGSTRVCIDYRDINKVTIFDAEPIPDIEELFIKLAGKKFFTKVDLSKGYWQIEVSEEDRPKTAFQAPQGLFQFTRMPFGLITAPATFARMMRMLELEKCSSMNFFDDILTASDTWEQHLIDVGRMLECLEKNGLTVRPSKIFAGFQELEFLGHMVGGGRIRPEKSKVEKILSVPRPTSKKQIRSLMGLLGYYRRYIPAYSVITAPITDQLKGAKKSIEWTADCEEALLQVQKLLSDKPILILPELNKAFTVQTDASNIGVAGVILQELGGKLHPVAYVSRKLLERETRYSTIEKECLAIVWTLKKLDRYLWGQKFTLQTDHKPLTFLKSAMFKNNRILGWSLAMQGYSFEVKEIAGKDNTLADILSRSGKDQTIP